MALLEIGGTRSNARSITMHEVLDKTIFETTKTSRGAIVYKNRTTCWSSICRCYADRCQMRDTIHATEVLHIHVLHVPHHHDIFRFDVAMDDVVVMQIAEPSKQFTPDPEEDL